MCEVKARETHTAPESGFRSEAKLFQPCSDYTLTKSAESLPGVSPLGRSARVAARHETQRPFFDHSAGPARGVRSNAAIRGTISGDRWLGKG
jgi:hypothetical protein